MATATHRVITWLGAAVVVTALAGCTQTDPASTGSSAGASANSSASASASASATPSTSPAPALKAQIAGGTTAITLDDGFTSALKTLNVTPSVLNRGGLTDAGVLSFPITGGQITYYDPATGVRPYVQGEIDHEDSGLALAAAGQKVELRNLIVHPGDDSHISGDVFLNGASVVRDADLFRLDGATLQPVTRNSDGDVVLTGTTVYVSSDAAALLNKTFGTTAVTDQLKVGTAELTVEVKG